MPLLLPPLLLPLLLAVSCRPAAALFNISNTLGDSMVLQRAPKAATVWGLGDAGVAVTATFRGKKLPPATVDFEGVWRVVLPPQPASKVGATITFEGSDGGSASLKDVLFGDVFLCGGQSNSGSLLHAAA